MSILWRMLTPQSGKNTFSDTRLARSHGFTLMELMIVLAIVAIASAIIIPRIGSSDAKLYQAQLRTLLATLNYNRRSAVIRNRQSEMSVFPFQENEEETPPVNKRRKGDWYSHGARVSWLSGTQKIDNKPFKISYFPQGGATGGKLELKQGVFTAILTIDGITGKVSVEEASDDSDS